MLLSVYVASVYLQTQWYYYRCSCCYYLAALQLRLWPIATHRVPWLVCVCVFLSFNHIREPSENGSTDRVAIYRLTRVGPRNDMY